MARQTVSDRHSSSDNGRGLSGTQADQINANFTELYPITTEITVTVGVGKNFESFHDAMVWATSRYTIGAGKVTISLDDGTHETGVAAEYYVNLNLEISSSSLSKFSCTLTYPSTDDGDAKPTTFNVGRGGDFLLKNINFDTTDNSYPYGNSAKAVHVTNGGRFHLYASNLYHFYTAVEVDRGHVLSSGLGNDEEVAWVTNGFIIDGMESTMLVEGDSTYLIVSATNELTVTNGGRVLDNTQTPLNLTCNIIENQIQHDGSYYINYALANTLKT